MIFNAGTRIFNKVHIFRKTRLGNAIAIHRASSEPAVQPDHPERHDLWGPIVIARDSALTENICVGVSDCARPEIWPNIFICGREREREEEERGERGRRDATGGGTGGVQWSAHNNGSSD